MSGASQTSRHRFSVSGPKFWLAYVAAAGSGMCSIPFIDWCRARLGLVSLSGATADSVLLTMLTAAGLLGGILIAAWEIARRMFEGDADLPESGRLLLLVYVSCAPSLLFSVFAYSEATASVGGAGLNPWIFILAWALFAAMVPVPFAVRDPRHGFFCASSSSLIAVSLLYPSTEPAGNGILYAIGAEMAIVFLYFTAGIWVQRIIAIMLTLLANCTPGLLGATVGTISWGIRRRAAKTRKEKTRVVEEACAVSDRGEELADEQY